jgi:hypothetical protein
VSTLATLTLAAPCSWALAGAMVVGLLSALGLGIVAYTGHGSLAWTSALLLVVSALVTTGCSWGLYTV